MPDRIPDDDTIWERYRGMRTNAIARDLKIDGRTLLDALELRGWRRARGGFRVTQAPCSTCSQTFEVTDDTVDRLCRVCRIEGGLTPNQRLYRLEYRRRAHRIDTPEWNRRYMRPGGPESRMMGTYG